MASKISNRIVQKFLDNVPWAKVNKKAATAKKGDRLFPSRTERNDAQQNFRLDKGAEVNGKPEVILQANSNAENAGVRAAAQKNSHAILAKGTTDSTADPEGSSVKQQLLDSFKKSK